MAPRVPSKSSGGSWNAEEQSPTELTPMPLPSRPGGRRLREPRIEASSTELLENINAMIQTAAFTTKYINTDAIDPDLNRRRLAVEWRTSLNQLKKFIQEFETTPVESAAANSGTEVAEIHPTPK